MINEQSIAVFLALIPQKNMTQKLGSWTLHGFERL